jgi:hypothetical protein
MNFRIRTSVVELQSELIIWIRISLFGYLEDQYLDNTISVQYQYSEIIQYAQIICGNICAVTQTFAVRQIYTTLTNTMIQQI